jgi:DNA-binding beta-propeller fold protein YncE
VIGLAIVPFLCEKEDVMEQRRCGKNETKVSLLLLGLCILLPLTGRCQDTAPLLLVQTIPLPHVEGRLDHMAIDLKGRRLFVAAHDNNTLEVVDLISGKQSRSIAALAEPQGVLYLPDTGVIGVTNGGDGSLRIFEERTFALVNTVKFSDDADNVRYDEAKKDIYVGYGRGALAVVDPKSNKQIADIPLSGHPESFQLEGSGTRVFVNVPSANHVAVVDRSKRAVIATWPLAGNGANFPMALDEPGKRLFVGCRKPARLLVYDTVSGKSVTSFDIGRDADDIFFDSASRRVYVSCGEGFLHVFQQADESRYRTIAKIQTTAGARTCLFVPKQGRLYLAAPRSRERQAEIRVYTVKLK